MYSKQQTNVLDNEHVTSHPVCAEARPLCGELWMCLLPKNDGSVQAGYRPVFVISNNKNNTYAPTVNVIPLTTKMNKRQLPIHVELQEYEKYGLKKPSTLLVEQITTVPLSCLDKRIGRIEDEQTLDAIRDAINVQFPILQMLSASKCH